MGTFIAEIDVDGTKFDARWIRLSISRKTNTVGKIVSTTQGGGVEFRVASSNSDFLAQKMVVCEHTPFDMTITYKEDSTTGVMKTIKLNHCFMTFYCEDFDADNEKEASTRCTVTCHEIEVGTALMRSNWTVNQ